MWEEVFAKYEDTAGNLHWHGTKTGEQIIKQDPLSNMSTFEAYSKEEIQEFFDAQRPRFWCTETRINPETMQTIYVLKWR